MRFALAAVGAGGAGMPGMTMAVVRHGNFAWSEGRSEFIPYRAGNAHDRDQAVKVRPKSSNTFSCFLPFRTHNPLMSRFIP
jgi:hypothetical protein